WSNIASLLTAGDDIDITGTTNATITLEDDIDLTALRASSASGLSLYEDGGTLGLFIEDTSGNVGIGTSSPEQQLTTTGNLQLGIADGDHYIYFDNGTLNNAGFRYNATTDEIEYSDDGVTWSAINALGGGAVSSVTNSDGTLTISPTTGDVVASLNLANANTWTGLQTFNNTYTDFAQYLRHAGDADTFFNLTDDNIAIQVGGETLINLTEDLTQDIVKLGDGGDVDINLNDDVFVEGSSGNVGIGTVSTTAKLSLAANTLATGGIDFGGDTNIYRSAINTLKTDDNFVLGTAGVGTTDSVITRETDGTLTARTIDSRIWGSSLVDGSGTGGYVTYWSDANTLTAEQYLSVTRGGLGGNVTAAGAGELLYSTGTSAYDSLAAGSTSQLLISGGAGAPSWSNVVSLLTAGDDIDITGTTNATITLEDDIDLTALRASSASGLSLYDDGGVLGLFLQDATGNIGIGTASPEQVIHADGNLQLGATDGTRYIYFDNGTVNNAGFRYNSTTDAMEFSDDGVTWNAFSSSGGIWSQNGNDAYYNTGNVGIGTDTPETSLNTTGDIQLGTTDGTRYIYFDNGTANNAGIRYNSSSNMMQYSHDGTSWYDFGTAGSNKFFTNTNAAVAAGSYLDVVHNQGTYNVIATAWIHNGTNWVEIDDMGRVAHNIYDPNLIGWYKAEETSGNLDNAEGTSSRDLIAKGSATYSVTGQINNAIDLDGATDFFCTGTGSTCTDKDNFDFGDGSFTIGGWFKHDNITTNPDYLVTKYSSSASADTGTGADGDINLTTGVHGTTPNINATAFIAGRTCADAPTYNVTALTSTTATVTPAFTTNCLAAG
ncbi:MAG: beta strand repeat-containing protein, partial [Patescibacteria group bacterium]